MSNKLYGPPKVGGDILSYCAKCKMELAHVIISMLDSRPAKVICKTCKAEHKFRLSPGTKAIGKRKAGTGTRGKLKSSITASELWEQKIAKSKSDTFPYDVKKEFSSGDLINHSTFGVGVVEESRGKGKMLVLFRVGEKVLIHGRS